MMILTIEVLEGGITRVLQQNTDSLIRDYLMITSWII